MSYEQPREPRETIVTDKARQGRAGRPVLMVLIGGLVLAMVAWGAAELFGWGIAPPAEQQVGNPATVEPDGTTGAITAPKPAVEPAPADQ